MTLGPQRWHWDDPIRGIREMLDTGGFLAIPTESSYGLAVDPRNRDGVESIFRFKSRSARKPLPIVAASLQQLAMLGIEIEDPRVLACAALWPAPLSLVIPTRLRIPAAGSGDTLAVRIPDHPRLLELLTRLGIPLTATSANREGEPPISDPDELARGLTGWPSLILDDGVLPGGEPSTMVFLGDQGLEILRQGRFPIAELRERLGEVAWDESFSAATEENSVDRSPGGR